MGKILGDIGPKRETRHYGMEFFKRGLLAGAPMRVLVFWPRSNGRGAGGLWSIGSDASDGLMGSLNKHWSRDVAEPEQRV